MLGRSKQFLSQVSFKIKKDFSLQNFLGLVTSHLLNLSFLFPLSSERYYEVFSENSIQIYQQMKTLNSCPAT